MVQIKHDDQIQRIARQRVVVHRQLIRKKLKEIALIRKQRNPAHFRPTRAIKIAEVAYEIFNLEKQFHELKSKEYRHIVLLEDDLAEEADARRLEAFHQLKQVSSFYEVPIRRDDPASSLDQQSDCSSGIETDDEEADIDMKSGGETDGSTSS